jgi:hypothetical protein
MVSLTVETRPLVYQYSGKDRVKDVVEFIKYSFPNENFSNYGMVFAFTLWMEEEKTLVDDYGISGDEVIEYKMNRWVLTVKDTQDRIAKLEFDPSCSVAEAIMLLMKQFPIEADEEYGLFVVWKDSNEKGVWLKDTKRLLSYPDIREKVEEEKKKKRRQTIIFFLNNTFFFSSFSRDKSISRPNLSCIR